MEKWNVSSFQHRCTSVFDIKNDNIDIFVVTLVANTSSLDQVRFDLAQMVKQILFCGKYSGASTIFCIFQVMLEMDQFIMSVRQRQFSDLIQHKW
jgi:hypothetical protein